MHGDYVKDCGAHHFYLSARPSICRYASEEMRTIYLSVSIRRMFICLNLYHDGLEAFIMMGSWSVGHAAHPSRWCKWDRGPCEYLARRKKGPCARQGRWDGWSTKTLAGRNYPHQADLNTLSLTLTKWKYCEAFWILLCVFLEYVFEILNGILWGLI